MKSISLFCCCAADYRSGLCRNAVCRRTRSLEAGASLLETCAAGDLDSYRNLWHANFLGWPGSSATPKRKDHITDWIANYTNKGLRLKSYNLKPAGSQATGNVVVTHYWITDRWVDKEGHGKGDTNRITHTWIRTPGGWQIIGGMSAPVTQGKR